MTMFLHFCRATPCGDARRGAIYDARLAAFSLVAMFYCVSEIGGVPGDTSVAPTFAIGGSRHAALRRGDMNKERRRLLSGLPAFWCCAAAGSDELDAAFEELVEGAAFEQAVLQEGDVDELVHHGLPGAVVGEHFGLLLFLGGDVLVAL